MQEDLRVDPAQITLINGIFLMEDLIFIDPTVICLVPNSPDITQKIAYFQPSFLQIHLFYDNHIRVSPQVHFFVVVYNDFSNKL